MIERKATVKNAMGIHCRPSAAILKEMKDYEGDITISSANGEAKLTSVMSLLGLGLEQGKTVTIYVDGPEEEKIGDRLVYLFEYNFDFPPRE